MQRFRAVLHGTLGSDPRDALLEGGAAAVARLPAPRALRFFPPPPSPPSPLFSLYPYMNTLIYCLEFDMLFGKVAEGTCTSTFFFFLFIF
jgi:hypothetical protein